MGSRERSEFIRNAIIHQLVDNTPTQVDSKVFVTDKRSSNLSVKDLEVQRIDRFSTIEGSDRKTDNSPDFDMIEEDIDSLEDKLDNLRF